VHRQLGGALRIVPIHGHHRSRTFHPFADHDPRPPRWVMAKLVLLARDHEIRDSTILEQIHA
jgi:hypothetical protein